MLILQSENQKSASSVYNINDHLITIYILYHVCSYIHMIFIEIKRLFALSIFNKKKMRKLSHVTILD